MLATPVTVFLRRWAGIPKVQQGELLLHDLFYYDWRQVKFNKSHAWVHPRIAVRNAKKITSLNKKEEDIILKTHVGD